VAGQVESVDVATEADGRTDPAATAAAAGGVEAAAAGGTAANGAAASEGAAPGANGAQAGGNAAGVVAAAGGVAGASHAMDVEEALNGANGTPSDVPAAVTEEVKADKAAKVAEEERRRHRHDAGRRPPEDETLRDPRRFDLPLDGTVGRVCDLLERLAAQTPADAKRRRRDGDGRGSSSSSSSARSSDSSKGGGTRSSAASLATGEAAATASGGAEPMQIDESAAPAKPAAVTEGDEEEEEEGEVPSARRVVAEAVAAHKQLALDFLLACLGMLAAPEGAAVSGDDVNRRMLEAADHAGGLKRRGELDKPALWFEGLPAARLVRYGAQHAYRTALVARVLRALVVAAADEELGQEARGALRGVVLDVIRTSTPTRTLAGHSPGGFMDLSAAPEDPNRMIGAAMAELALVGRSQDSGGGGSSSARPASVAAGGPAAPDTAAPAPAVAATESADGAGTAAGAAAAAAAPGSDGAVAGTGGRSSSSSGSNHRQPMVLEDPQFEVNFSPLSEVAALQRLRRLVTVEELARAVVAALADQRQPVQDSALECVRLVMTRSAVDRSGGMDSGGAGDAGASSIGARSSNAAAVAAAGATAPASAAADAGTADDKADAGEKGEVPAEQAIPTAAGGRLLPLWHGRVMVHALINELCESCYDSEWRRKVAACRGLKEVCRSLRWEAARVFEFKVMQALLFVIRDQPREASVLTIEEAQEALYGLLTARYSIGEGPAATRRSTATTSAAAGFAAVAEAAAAPAGDAAAATAAAAAAGQNCAAAGSAGGGSGAGAPTAGRPELEISMSIVHLLATELTCYKASVRSVVKRALEVLAAAKGTTVAAILFPRRRAIEEATIKRSLAGMQATQQIGALEALTHCLVLEPPLLQPTPTVAGLLAEAMDLSAAEERRHPADGGAPTLYNSLPGDPAERRAVGYLAFPSRTEIRDQPLPSELPYGVQLRISVIRLMHAIMVFNYADGVVPSPLEEAPALKRRCLELLFASLTSHAPSQVIEAAFNVLMVVTNAPSPAGRRDRNVPKDLLQECLKPVLRNFISIESLSLANLSGLSRLLQLLAPVFNATLADRLYGFLRQFAEPSALIELQQQQQQQPQGASSGHRRGWRPGEEPDVAAAVLSLFPLLPPSAKWIEPLVTVVIKLEHALPRYSRLYCRPTSPFRAPLAAYLAKHPRESLEML
ncbi:unnamed protein product, partial [Phaeothamnion confervicola]